MKTPNEPIGREREESAVSQSSPVEECDNFARVFSEKLEQIHKIRTQAVQAGTIPSEAGRPSLAPGETGLLKNRYTANGLSLAPASKNRLLPLLKIDASTRKMSLEIHEIGPDSPVSARKIGDSLITMSEAVRHINSEADGKEKYTRVYYFVMAFINYLEGAEPIPADYGKIREFLDTVEFTLPDHIADQIYKRAFNLPRIKGLMTVIRMNKDVAVKKDDFRQWLGDFAPQNKGMAECLGLIKNIVSGQLRGAFIERVLAELKSPLPIEVPSIGKAQAGSLPPPITEFGGPVTKRFGARKQSAQTLSGPFRITPSVRPSGPNKLSMHPLPLTKRKDTDAIRGGVANQAGAVIAGKTIGASAYHTAGADESPENAVGEARIIDVGESVEGLAADLFQYIRDQKQKPQGARFTGMHMSMMCSLLFEDLSRLIDNKGSLNHAALENISFKSAFEKHPNPQKGEKALIVLLHKLKMRLAKQGCLNNQREIEAARSRFVIAIRTVNK